MRTTIAVLLVIAAIGLAQINWTWNQTLVDNVESEWNALVLALYLGCADSLEYNGVMFEMPSAIRTYYRSQAISRWVDWKAAVDSLRAWHNGG